MKYLQKTFSVHMPGDKVKWPFSKKETGNFGACMVCGYIGATSNTLAHIRHGDEGRPLQRICFGR